MVDMINGNIPDIEEKKIEEYCPLIKLTMGNYYSSGSNIQLSILQDCIYTNSERNDLNTEAYKMRDLHGKTAHCNANISCKQKQENKSVYKLSQAYRISTAEKRTELKYITYFLLSMSKMKSE